MSDFPLTVSWETFEEQGANLARAVNERDNLLIERVKLLKIAKAAGEFLNSHCWEEDDEEEKGEDLANAMNEWINVENNR